MAFGKGMHKRRRRWLLRILKIKEGRMPFCYIGVLIMVVKFVLRTIMSESFIGCERRLLLGRLRHCPL